AVVAAGRERAQPRREMLGDEDVIAAIRRLAFLALVHTEGGRARHAAVERLPGVHELGRAANESLQESRAQRILRRQVEVAADDRRLRMRERAVRTLVLLGDALEVGFAVQLAQAL